MNMKNLSVRRLVRCAVIAAVYVVVCLVLAPFSYGAVQVRVAEALCLLPVFGAEYIVGVTLGCFLANLLGSIVVDVVSSSRTAHPRRCWRCSMPLLSALASSSAARFWVWRSSS